MQFLKTNQASFQQFYSEDYLESYNRMIIEGVVPFIEAYVEKMSTKGTRKDREMLATISRRLSKVRGEKNNIFGLF